MSSESSESAFLLSLIFMCGFNTVSPSNIFPQTVNNWQWPCISPMKTYLHLRKEGNTVGHDTLILITFML